MYEAKQFPEKASDPWDRCGTMDCERWLSAGWFFQEVDLGDWAPAPGGEQDKYQRWLADFVGEDDFFIEWRMHTNGDSSEIPGTAPSSMVASGVPGTEVSYHFTIADDQVRFNQDNLLPLVCVDIDPAVPHTYRLELYGDRLFVWYIDHRIAASGLPEGAFPTSEFHVISWRSKSWYLTSTVWWDYIRYGTIPIDASGDYDSNETIDLFDFYFFNECLSSDGPESDAGPGCRFADFDFDTDVDLSDLAAFQNAFTGPP